MPRVAIYIQSKYAKQTYAVESYDVRAWPGMEMVRDALERAGIEVGYCTQDTVDRYDVVLMSITGMCDWWPFVAERLTWPRGRYQVVVGGAAVLNIRPFLEYADYFVLGRGERVAPPLVAALLRGEAFEHPSVVRSRDFSPDKAYLIAQAEACYEHTTTMANGKPFTEEAIGCQQRCLFCGYTWQRAHVGMTQRYAGAGNALYKGSDERTMFELDLDHPETWDVDYEGKKSNKLRIIGLDGLSERLRRMVNKPITREMLHKFLAGLHVIPHPHRVKVYNIIGYPTETESDQMEFIDTLIEADATTPSLGDRKQWGIELVSTPFRAMPATPGAYWPMSYVNYRYSLGPRFKSRGYYRPWEGKENVFFQGRSLWSYETFGTEHLATVVFDCLGLRGTEDHAAVARAIVLNRAFWGASGAVRLATLERYLDVEDLFRPYRLHDLPTRYLRTYVTPEGMLRAQDKRLRAHGGEAGARIADYIAGKREDWR